MLRVTFTNQGNLALNLQHAALRSAVSRRPAKSERFCSSAATVSAAAGCSDGTRVGIAWRAAVLGPAAHRTRHVDLLGEFLALPGVHGNRVPHAHLAALAVEHELTLCSTDGDLRDFRDCSGLIQSRHEQLRIIWVFDAQPLMPVIP